MFQLVQNLQKRQEKKIGRSGENNAFYGKRHSDDFKKKISLLNKGKDRRSSESIKMWIENVAKAPKSKEHREKIGRKGMIMLQNLNTLETIRIDKQQKHLYDSSIWMNPAKVKSILKRIKQ